jgi:hypothetical protein
VKALRLGLEGVFRSELAYALAWGWESASPSGQARELRLEAELESAARGRSAWPSEKVLLEAE